jgi:hypothetical protein
MATVLYPSVEKAFEAEKERCLILGLDPGTTGLGACFLNPKTNLSRTIRTNLFPNKASRAKRELFNRVRVWCEIFRPLLEKTAYVMIEELVVPRAHPSVVAVASLLEACIYFMFPNLRGIAQANPKTVRAHFGIHSRRGEKLTYAQRKRRSVLVFERNGYLNPATYAQFRKRYTLNKKFCVDPLEAFLLARYCQALVAAGKFTQSHVQNPSLDSIAFTCHFTPRRNEYWHMELDSKLPARKPSKVPPKRQATRACITQPEDEEVFAEVVVDSADEMYAEAELVSEPGDVVYAELVADDDDYYRDEDEEDVPYADEEEEDDDESVSFYSEHVSSSSKLVHISDEEEEVQPIAKRSKIDPELSAPVEAFTLEEEEELFKTPIIRRSQS